MMVFNTQPSIRGICANVFMQFLLDYPLSPERVEQHINFLIKNLGCNKVQGRLQLLDVLKSLFEKLPGNILDLYCELLFFTLLLRVVNDENAECRTKAQKVLQTLSFSSKINHQKIKTLLNTVLKMGSTDDAKREMLLMAKLQAFQLLVQRGGEKETSLKLKREEMRSIMQTVFDEVIKGQVADIESQVEAATAVKDDEASDVDTGVKSFL